MTLPLFGLFGWRAILVLPFSLTWMTVVAWKQVQRTQWTADRRCRGLSQRVVVAQRHDCAGREDSDCRVYESPLIGEQ